MTNVSWFLTESADMYPDGVAVRSDDETTTYSSLAQWVARFATELATQGLQPGDRVGVMAPNVRDFAVTFYGALHAGAVVVPISPERSAAHVESFLKNTGAQVVFSSPECAAACSAGAKAAGTRHAQLGEQTWRPTRELARHPRPVRRAAEDTAMIVHTSGTHAAPKGAELTHANFLRNQAVVARTVLELQPDDVVMAAVPLSHAFGITCGLGAAFYTGATLALLPRFDPRQALARISAERVSVFQGVPTMYSAMLAVADRVDTDTSSLRLCVSSGAPLEAEILHRFEDTFGCQILEGYGAAETSGVASFNRPDRVCKAGSIGTPIHGVQMRVVDQDGRVVPAGVSGAIHVRGHNVMKGYWNSPHDTQIAMVHDWCATGDIGWVDTDGYYFLSQDK
ncbi:MAG: long-chain acyl-CoA synthetase [Mycobacterium sp.]|nr:long-chain acyl-CoA synthetase [Mycobacterium sp.]